MDKINLLVIATLITLFISLLLIFFLLTVKTKDKTSNILFAVFLFLNAVDSTDPLFGLLSDGPSNLGMFKTTVAFLQIPIFYLYVLSVSYSDFRLKPQYLIHAVPFLIVNAVLMPRFYFADAASKMDFIVNRKSMIELQFSHILLHIQIIVYFTAIFILLKKAKKLYVENNAGTHINSYNWLFQFTTLLSILYLVAIVKNVFKFSEYPDISEWIKVGIMVLQPFIICWYLFKALNNPDLFRNIDSKLKLVRDIISEERINTSAPIAVNDKMYSEELLKLRKYMNEKKPFLNPSLTIQDVSNDIQIPVRDLSLLINHKLEQHFYDFINAYRIENAKDILKDVTKSKVTILEILYEVGFNSKSSFNSAFKKHTGFTPTDFRKAL